MWKTQNKPFFLKYDTDLSFFFLFIFLLLRFEFPTRRQFFPPTGDFQIFGFYANEQALFGKNEFNLIKKKKRRKLKVKQFPQNVWMRSSCFLENPDGWCGLVIYFFFPVIFRFSICCCKNAICKKTESSNKT